MYVTHLDRSHEQDATPSGALWSLSRSDRLQQRRKLFENYTSRERVMLKIVNVKKGNLRLNVTALVPRKDLIVTF